MLGKKTFLWTNIFFNLVIFIGACYIAGLWRDLCVELIPESFATAFFYFVIVAGIIGYHCGGVAGTFCNWNWDRYEAEYELKVNNFLYHYVELMDYKLNRHKEFKELRDLLQMAIALSRGEQKCSI